MTVQKFLLVIAAALFCQTVSFAQKYKVEKLSELINTSNYDEISPVVSIDGNRIYFTRVGYHTYRQTLIENGDDLSKSMEQSKFRTYLRSIYSKLANHSVLNPETSGFNQDIWIALRGEERFDKITHPNYPLNNALPNSVCSLTPSANEVIVINQFMEEGGMKKGFSLVRQESDGSWTFPSPLQINNYHNSGPDVSMTMSHDGSAIILAMKRADSYGDTDLYISYNLGDNQWSEPVNMGKHINSPFRETTPFISADNSTLFFSSNRHGTLGGNDIFLMKRKGNDWTSWTRPKRFISPINTRYDESQPYFDMSSGYLYFTSKRDGTSDIFKVKLGPPIPIGVSIKGRIINSKTGKLVEGKVLSGKLGSKFRNTFVSDDGHYHMIVPKGVQYELAASAPGYTSGKGQSLYFDRNHVFYKTYKYDLYVDPMEPGMQVEVDPIFFQQSKPTVLEQSYPALDKLAKYLSDNSHLYVRIEGHTDNQGDQEALQKLSEERALAIKDYLVYKKRLNPVRIETAGYGPNRPLTDNSSEENRAQNRRVEVRITHIDPVMLGLQGGKK
ncbi:MAG: OmpA family protein [Bacteroidota bacterium]